MCKKCIEIDKAIAQYRNIVRSITDQPTVDRAKELIAELESELRLTEAGDLRPDANYFQLANHASTSFLLWSFAYPYRC
jgi:hypothetical protein